MLTINKFSLVGMQLPEKYKENCWDLCDTYLVINRLNQKKLEHMILIMPRKFRPKDKLLCMTFKLLLSI
jgi:hypothetical protein